MQVSVETLNGLERKVTVLVPNEKVDEELNLRLRNLAPNAVVDGYRRGKAPMSRIKREYMKRLCAELTGHFIQTTLFEAMKDISMTPAGYPQVDPQPLEEGKDFSYTATFEIFPEIKINELKGDSIEVVKAKVTDADVDHVIEKMREQSKEWKTVERAVKDGDKVNMNFKGYVDDEPFDGGESDGFDLEIGSGSMIPGFESGIIGHKAGKPFSIEVTFPEDYGHKPLSGKKARFDITINKIEAGELAALDDNLAEKFNIKEGGLQALRKDVRENMERELERRVNAMNRERIFDALLKVNTFDLPGALIDNEIENLKHELFHRLFGHEHHENEKIPDFPRVLFEDQAKKRVQLGLLFAEYVKKHNIVADETRIDAVIEKFASAYEDPQELRDWYKEDKERRNEVESLVIEEIVAEKIGETAKLVDKKMSYDEVMNPKKEEATENKGD